MPLSCFFNNIATITLEKRLLQSKFSSFQRSTVNDYPIGHKFYPSVNWQLLNEQSRTRPGLPTKRGKRKRENGNAIPANKAVKQSIELNEYEEIVSNDDE